MDLSGGDATQQLPDEESEQKCRTFVVSGATAGHRGTFLHADGSSAQRTD